MEGEETDSLQLLRQSVIHVQKQRQINKLVSTGQEDLVKEDPVYSKYLPEKPTSPAVNKLAKNRKPRSPETKYSRRSTSKVDKGSPAQTEAQTR